MDTEIDQMIAECIQSVKIIIDPETQVGQGAADFIALNTIESSFYTCPIERLQAQVEIVRNIGMIIKNPSAFETVKIDDEQKKKQKKQRQKMTAAANILIGAARMLADAK